MGIHIALLCAWLASASATLEVVNQWNVMQFDFPPDPVLLEKFQPENTVPTGLEIGWDRIYFGIPRLRAGVPATLAWVPRSLPPGVSPVLQVTLVIINTVCVKITTESQGKSQLIDQTISIINYGENV